MSGVGRYSIDRLTPIVSITVTLCICRSANSSSDGAVEYGSSSGFICQSFAVAFWLPKPLERSDIGRPKPTMAGRPSLIWEQVPAILFGKDELPPKGIGIGFPFTLYGHQSNYTSSYFIEKIKSK
jgi:hypothetical protein